MMTENDRNIRTLIICFVFALFTLVPLKVIESQKTIGENVRVLGEETYEEEENWVDDGSYVIEEEIYEDEMVLEEGEYVEEVFEEEIIEEEDYVVEEVVDEEIQLPNAEI